MAQHVLIFHEQTSLFDNAEADIRPIELNLYETHLQSVI